MIENEDEKNDMRSLESDKKKIPIFIYYRISTELQNFDAQKKIIENFLALNPDKYEIKGVFKDKGLSGALDPKERPEFNEMINRLKEVKAILCYDWDRISRDVKFASYFMFFLKETGISVIEGGTGKVLNFDQMSDRIWTYLKSEMAQDERERIKRRQKAGIQAFKEKHGRWGQKPKYGGGADGRSFSERTFWEKYETLRLANVSKASIARLFKMSTPTLYKRLKTRPRKYLEIENEVKKRYSNKSNSN
ncbi:MAG: recombinase family protein [Promethearchaeota archaeon]